MSNVGILLAGCGRYDGSDVTETVLLASSLERAGHRVIFLAPDSTQADVVDHATGCVDEGARERNILNESARLAGGQVRDVEGVHPSELDALVIPGGIGVVRNLCPGGSGMLGGGEPLPAIARLLRSLKERGTVVAGFGPARVLLLHCRGESPSDEQGMPPVDPSVVEEMDGLLYSPGRMGSDSISDIGRGIDLLVKKLGDLLGARDERTP